MWHVYKVTAVALNPHSTHSHSLPHSLAYKNSLFYFSFSHGFSGKDRQGCLVLTGFLSFRGRKHVIGGEVAISGKSRREQRMAGFVSETRSYGCESVTSDGDFSQGSHVSQGPGKAKVEWSVVLRGGWVQVNRRKWCHCYACGV